MKPFYEKVPRREKSSFFAYEKICDSFELSWHYHPEYEITAILKGKGRRYIGDSITDYSPVDMVMLPPSVPHSWQAAAQTGGCRALVIQFSRQVIESCGLGLSEFLSIDRLLTDCSGGLEFDGSAELTLLMQRIVATDGLESLILLLELLQRLSGVKARSITMAGAFSLRHQDDCDRVNRLFDYIAANLNENINLEKAAAAACISKSAFCAFFKRITGKSFIQYVNDSKISLACKLLRESEKTVTQICYEAGFANIANFNRQFKKRIGKSPKQYRLASDPFKKTSISVF